MIEQQVNCLPSVYVASLSVDVRKLKQGNEGFSLASSLEQSWAIGIVQWFSTFFAHGPYF